MIEYRWAEGHYERLAVLADDLVRRPVAVIFANGPAVVAAKKATTTIPIVFATGLDPIASGLVSSLSQPSGNLTGFTSRLDEAYGKPLESLHDLLPTVTTFGLLTRAILVPRPNRKTCRKRHARSDCSSVCCTPRPRVNRRLFCDFRPRRNPRALRRDRRSVLRLPP